MDSMDNNVVLSIDDLHVKFSLRGDTLNVIRGISLDIHRGESIAIVGESGSGKSVFTKTFLGMLDSNGRIDSGHIYFRDKDKDGNENVVDLATYATEKEWLTIRGKQIAMIMQDPMTSLNPLKTIGHQLEETVLLHRDVSKEEAHKRAVELLTDVGINDPERRCKQYPHEFSGGQRQRIGIARALAVEPEFIICDEPISALDVSIQAQVINMLEDLQRERGLTYLFIAHDLSMVKHISDRIGVMYLGKIVELTDADELYSNPKHPYTQALLSAIPIPDPEVAKKNQRILLEGDVPSPINPPSGCRFRTRCQYAMDICAAEEPVTRELSEGHYCACHLYNDK